MGICIFGQILAIGVPIDAMVMFRMLKLPLRRQVGVALLGLCHLDDIIDMMFFSGGISFSGDEMFFSLIFIHSDSQILKVFQNKKQLGCQNGCL